MSNYKLITPQADLVITVAEAKKHLNLSDSETFWDDYIETLIVIANDVVQQKTWRALLEQTWLFTMDSSEIGRIVYLTKCPLISVESIIIVGPNGEDQTLSASDYTVDTISEPARILFDSVPSVKSETMNALKVTFKSGYTDASAVPPSIKAAMKLIVGDYFMHREDSEYGKSYTIPNSADNSLRPYTLNFVYVDTYGGVYRQI